MKNKIIKNKIFSSLIWCKDDNQSLFIIEMSDVSATGRSKYESDIVNCVIVIMDFYYIVKSKYYNYLNDYRQWTCKM